MGYLVFAFVAAAITATMQGFRIGRWQWIAAALGGPVIGLAIGVLKRLVSRTDLRRWVLAGSLLTLSLTVAGARCAMCFFVGG
jgi:hypothetical protein